MASGSVSGLCSSFGPTIKSRLNASGKRGMGRISTRFIKVLSESLPLSEVATIIGAMLPARVLPRFFQSRSFLYSPLHCYGLLMSRNFCIRDPQTTPVKRFKAAGKEDQVQAVVFPPLSPEQQDRIQRNKQAALKRLAAHRVPNGFGETWGEALTGEFIKPYFIKLTTFVAEERKRGTVYPPPDQVFTWTQMCSIRTVKVVILGQDPYHGPNQAHGLCFSVQRPVPPPPSLENMYKELATDIEGFTHPGHGDLTGWAKQGVLLLNAVLTVKAHNANSHKDRGWEQFTDAVVSWLNKNSEGLVFMLWGAYAQKKGSSIDRKHHHVLQAVHPSPLSAHRGFFGCKHFSKTNEFLVKAGKEPIDWKKL